MGPLLRGQPRRAGRRQGATALWYSTSPVLCTRTLHPMYCVLCNPCTVHPLYSAPPVTLHALYSAPPVTLLASQPRACPAACSWVNHVPNTFQPSRNLKYRMAPAADRHRRRNGTGLDVSITRVMDVYNVMHLLGEGVVTVHQHPRCSLHEVLCEGDNVIQGARTYRRDKL